MTRFEKCVILGISKREGKDARHTSPKLPKVPGYDGKKEWKVWRVLGMPEVSEVQGDKANG